MRVLAPEDLEGVDEERHVLARLEDADEEQVAPGEAVALAHPPQPLRVGVGGEVRAGGERHRHDLVGGDGEAREDLAAGELRVGHHAAGRPQGAADQHAKEQPEPPRDGPGEAQRDQVVHGGHERAAGEGGQLEVRGAVEEVEPLRAGRRPAARRRSRGGAGCTGRTAFVKRGPASPGSGRR